MIVWQGHAVRLSPINRQKTLSSVNSVSEQLATTISIDATSSEESNDMRMLRDALERLKACQSDKLERDCTSPTRYPVTRDEVTNFINLKPDWRWETVHETIRVFPVSSLSYNHDLYLIRVGQFTKYVLQQRLTHA